MALDERARHHLNEPARTAPRASLEEDMRVLRAELPVDMEGLRSEMHRGQARIVIALVMAMITLDTALTGLVATFV